MGKQPRRRICAGTRELRWRVTSPDGWAWATAEGTATLTGPGTDPYGPEVEALVHYYRIAAGSTRIGTSTGR